MPRQTDLFTFKTVFVQSKDLVVFVAQGDALAEQGSDASSLIRFIPSLTQWGSAFVHWAGLRVCASPAPEVRFFMLGVGGEILHLVRGGKPAEEMIDDGPEGVKNRGPMRDLRWIGGHLYACGMGRQVYRRDGPGNWARADAGTVQPLGDMTVAGFSSIDGISEDDFSAVGFGGEVWRCQGGRWKQPDSPTNVVLSRLKVVRPDLAYAVGQRGVLLEGRGDAWRSIDQQLTEDDLWGVEWFGGRLWVASAKAVYRLTSKGDLEEVDMGLGANRTYYDLHANDGVLWSVGPKHLSWTKDGSTWNDVTS